MKKVLVFIVFSLLMSVNSKATHEWINTFNCESIVSNGKWYFTLTDIKEKNSSLNNKFIEADQLQIPGKNYGQLNSDGRFFWFTIFKDDDGESILIVNILDTDDRKKDNYIAIMVFFDRDYKKSEIEKLENLFNNAKNLGKEMGVRIQYLQAEQKFFNLTDNFIKTRLKLGKESFDKGNWQTLERATCKFEPIEVKHKQIKQDSNQTIESTKELQKKLKQLNKKIKNLN